MPASDFDLVSIGSGPAGVRAAIQAAKLHRRAAVVEQGRNVGGVCVNTGTIPSKTMREAILHLTGMRQRGFYGQGYRVKSEVTFEDIHRRTQTVIEREQQVLGDQLARNHVAVVEGRGSLVDPHTVRVSSAAGDERQLTAQSIVIATGSTPAHPPGVEFDGTTILDSDQILELGFIPNELVVVGAGVIGIEYTSMFAALGSRVTIVDSNPTMLDFCDEEIVEALRYHLRDLGVTFRFGETVEAVEHRDDRTLTRLASGKQILADAVFYSAGRQGASAGLGLEELGIAVDRRGRIAVGTDYRTSVESVLAVGDVIGFPSLASVSAEQGRVAACAALEIDSRGVAELLPFGIYAIPEISYVGRTEAELTDAGVPYEVGVARYRELARGVILGEQYGLLKLLVSTDDGRLLGVHAFGTGATELVHIGQTAMGLGGTVDFFVDSVFNYPTLAEAYKIAALNAMNKLRELAV
ncbi:MAG TPA: Si-specific NAD(P)(+) transhydrogenase [Gaiellaceae bacterium]|jgi:NAD(P) transhydrogenase|nr:Si-specific NAD(P)(+) transhydrogenase [Gaiellaceae bacterium]